MDDGLRKSDYETELVLEEHLDNEQVLVNKMKDLNETEKQLKIGLKDANDYINSKDNEVAEL